MDKKVSFKHWNCWPPEHWPSMVDHRWGGEESSVQDKVQKASATSMGAGFLAMDYSCPGKYTSCLSSQILREIKAEWPHLRFVGERRLTLRRSLGGRLLWMLTVCDSQCPYDEMLKQKCQHTCPAISSKLRTIGCLLRAAPTWVKPWWKEIVDYRSVKACVHRQQWPFLKQQWQLQIAFSLQSHSLNSASRCINHPNPGSRETACPTTLVHLWP